MKRLRIVHTMNNTAHGGLQYEHLTSGGRGVTGSEQALLYLAAGQAALGHEVTVYVPTDSPGYAYGVEVLDYASAWPRLRKMDMADVVISWLSADSLRGVPDNKLRIHSVQINDWWINALNYQSWVDVFVCVSEIHRDFLWSQTGNPGFSKYVEILPNGTDFIDAGHGIRKSKKCVYSSSPDRGLHWLLHIWPEILCAHPSAELHIYYEIQKWMSGAVLLNSEAGIRGRYVVDRLNRSMPNVFVHGAISPKELAKELATSDVMLYPCDTIRFTEGFGVAVLDACASGVVPVLTDCDALSEIYKNSGAIIIEKGDSREWIDRFRDEAIRLLSTPQEIEQRRNQVMAFAGERTWSLAAHKWQNMIERYLYAKSIMPAKTFSVPCTAAIGTRGPAGGEGPLCVDCGVSEWVELAGGPSNDAYKPNVDKRQLPTVDIVQNLEAGIPFHNNHATRLKMIDVFNYFTKQGAELFLKDCLRVLKPGGSFFLRTVSLDVACQQITRHGLSDAWLEVIYHSPDCAEGETGEGVHRWGYTFESIKALLEKVGFVNITHQGYYNPHEMKIEAWKESPNKVYLEQLPLIQ